LPLSSADKDQMESFSRCFNCGFCDTVCPALLEQPREKFPGPSYLVTTLARSLPDFWAVRLDLSLCDGCKLCQKACPNQVPIKQALEFIHAKAEYL
jgi:heterodisulfide reductase subunit C